MSNVIMYALLSGEDLLTINPSKEVILKLRKSHEEKKVEEFKLMFPRDNIYSKEGIDKDLLFIIRKQEIKQLKKGCELVSTREEILLSFKICAS